MLYFSFKRYIHWIGLKHPNSSWKVNVERSQLICHQSSPPSSPPHPLIPFYLPNHLVFSVTVLSHGELNLMNYFLGKPIKKLPQEVTARKDKVGAAGF